MPLLFDLVPQLFVQRLRGSRFDLQLATFLFERLLLDTQLRLVVSPLPRQFRCLLPELLRLVLKIPLDLFDSPLALVELFAAVRQRVGRQTGGLQVRSLLLQQDLTAREFGFLTRQNPVAVLAAISGWIAAGRRRVPSAR